MDLAPDSVSKRLVDHLMPRQAALAVECSANNDSLVVALAISDHACTGALESLLDQAFYLFRIHNN